MKKKAYEGDFSGPKMAHLQNRHNASATAALPAARSKDIGYPTHQGRGVAGFSVTTLGWVESHGCNGRKQVRNWVSDMSVSVPTYGDFSGFLKKEYDFLGYLELI